MAAVDRHRPPIFPVCAATMEQWRAYAESDYQVIRSTSLEWAEGTIYMVELPSQEQQHFTRRFERYFIDHPAFDTFMATHGSAGIPNHPTLPSRQADSSYGPTRQTGSRLPPGVGVGSLDWKAQQWTQFPGVRFILCVAITDRLATAEYKLYTVERNFQTNEADQLPQLAFIRVKAPHTVVTFDSYELLGLAPGAAIPQDSHTKEQFPDPAIQIDMYEVLLAARRT